MSWRVQEKWYERLAVDLIKCGPIPHHVAFIMDGNRRYARSKNLETIRGHEEGTNTLKRLSHWCKLIGIAEITVYAFSKDNFKSSKEEVHGLMELLQSQFNEVVDEFDDFEKDDVRVRFIGNLDLLPQNVQKVAAKAATKTKNHKSFIINVALAYTSRDEMTNAIKTVVEGVQSGALQTSDIDEELLSNCMYTNNSPDPDILIRTSGETRFSDFLTWQSGKTYIFVEEVMWPQYSLWYLLKNVFWYQIICKNKVICNEKRKQSSEPSNTRKISFVKNVIESRVRSLERHLPADA